MAIDKRMRAALSIVAARRVAQLDQRRITDVAAYRRKIERNVWDEFGLIWRRLLLEQPHLDGHQLADAVEPIEAPKPIDPEAGQRAAARRRMERPKLTVVPRLDPDTFASVLKRARDALHPDNRTDA